jgi:hypothetical protein
MAVPWLVLVGLLTAATFGPGTIRRHHPDG